MKPTNAEVVTLPSGWREISIIGVSKKNQPTIEKGTKNPFTDSIQGTYSLNKQRGRKNKANMNIEINNDFIEYCIFMIIRK